MAGSPGSRSSVSHPQRHAATIDLVLLIQPKYRRKNSALLRCLPWKRRGPAEARGSGRARCSGEKLTHHHGAPAWKSAAAQPSTGRRLIKAFWLQISRIASMKALAAAESFAAQPAGSRASQTNDEFQMGVALPGRRRCTAVQRPRPAGKTFSLCRMPDLFPRATQRPPGLRGRPPPSALR